LHTTDHLIITVALGPTLATFVMSKEVSQAEVMTGLLLLVSLAMADHVTEVELHAAWRAQGLGRVL